MALNQCRQTSVWWLEQIWTSDEVELQIKGNVPSREPFFANYGVSPSQSSVRDQLWLITMAAFWYKLLKMKRKFRCLLIVVWCDEKRQMSLNNRETPDGAQQVVHDLERHLVRNSLFFQTRNWTSIPEEACLKQFTIARTPFQPR